MKRRIGVFLLSFMMVFLTLAQTVPVYAASMKLSGVPKSAVIGKTFTATVAFPDDVGGFVYVDYSTDVLEYVSGSGAEIQENGGQIYYAGMFGTVVKLTFKTKAEGTGKIVVTTRDNESKYSDEPIEVGGASATITVKNESEDDTKSADNSLASLKISPGRLSPSFKSGTLNYTATVDNSVTKISVTAKANHSAAVVESVTGNDNLKVGKNTIKIVVKAENGTKATYKITVTRKDTTEEDPVEPDAPIEPEVDDSDVTIESGGETYYVESNFLDENLPDDFAADTIQIDGKDVNCASFGKGDLTLLSLKQSAESEASWFVYDQKQKAVYPFMKLISENGYILLLLPDVSNVPTGYVESSVSIEGKGVMKAYQSEEVMNDKLNDPESPDNTEGDSVGFLQWFAPETVYADEVKESDFYLVYAMNQNGNVGWYQYDNVDGTYMRFVERVVTLQEEENAVDENEELVKKFNKLQDENEELQNKYRMMICVFIFVVAVFLVIIVNIIIFRGGKKKSEEDEDRDLTFLDL